MQRKMNMRGEKYRKTRKHAREEIAVDRRGGWALPLVENCYRRQACKSSAMNRADWSEEFRPVIIIICQIKFIPSYFILRGRSAVADRWITSIACLLRRITRQYFQIIDRPHKFPRKQKSTANDPLYIILWRILRGCSIKMRLQILRKRWSAFSKTRWKLQERKIDITATWYSLNRENSDRRAEILARSIIATWPRVIISPICVNKRHVEGRGALASFVGNASDVISKFPIQCSFSTACDDRRRIKITDTTTGN